MDEIHEDEGVWPVPDFSVESERLRLGPSGLTVFLNIAVQWKLTDEETLELLALGSETRLEQLKTNPIPRLFTEERMFRISYLIGIYKGLHICHGNALADDWIKLPNRNRISGGSFPIEFIICGGLDAMHQVRMLIDARSAGN